MGRVDEHVEAFNEAVTRGDFAQFADRFGGDAVLSFVGPAAGPFRGRDEIRAGYQAMPPDDTMEVTGVETAGQVDTVRFRWSRGGTGTMVITWRGAEVADLTVSFDDVVPRETNGPQRPAR